MNYALAKERQEAGFPQGGDGKWIHSPDQLVARKADRIYVPTLSELIEACRFAFRSLTLLTSRKGWKLSGIVRALCGISEQMVLRAFGPHGSSLRVALRR